MRKKAAAVVLCVLMVFQLALFPARAAEQVYFVAAGIDILPLSDATMPFWSGGYLYIPASIFTGAVRKTLEVEYTYEGTSQIAILYDKSGDGRILLFGMGENHAVDNTGAVSYPGALRRNGTVYVPAALVAKTFGLQYSVIDVDHGYLVWLRKPDFGLSDKSFANAATYSMAARYEDYRKAQRAEEETVVEGPDASPDLFTGKRVYLCLEAGDDTEQVLDALDQRNAQAAFFCTPEFLEKNGDLLRRMTATGQAVGILVDAADPGRSVEEQLEAGNRALARATCGKTRLVSIRNGEEQTLQTARSLGYVCLEPDLDRAGYELRTTGNANALFKRVSARRGDVTVWLADTAQAAGVRAFLSTALRAEARCLALTETA